MSSHWYVITGGPSCGKTTVLNQLEKQGYLVIEEAARKLIDQEMAKGKTLAEIRKNERKFQDKVLKIKIKTEKSLPQNEVIFLDRGIPDTTAYYRFVGFEGDELLEKAIRNCSYKKVFLLDLLPYEKDYARTESEEEAKQLHALLREAYRELGFEVIEVPVLPIEERINYILSFL